MFSFEETLNRYVIIWYRYYSHCTHIIIICLRRFLFYIQLILMIKQKYWNNKICNIYQNDQIWNIEKYDRMNRAVTFDKTGVVKLTNFMFPERVNVPWIECGLFHNSWQHFVHYRFTIFLKYRFFRIGEEIFATVNPNTKCFGFHLSAPTSNKNCAFISRAICKN